MARFNTALLEPAAHSGAYLVVCQRWYGGTTSYIDGCRIGGDGANLGYSYISSSTGYIPAVVDGKNAKEYLVAWAFDNYTLEARFVDYSGGVAAASPQLSGVYLSRPAIASGSSVSFLVAFQDLYTSGYPTDIYGWLWGSQVYLPFVAKSY